MPFAPIVASAVLDSLLAASNTIASQPRPATNQRFTSNSFRRPIGQTSEHLTS
jgi:hypothetical protein